MKYNNRDEYQGGNFYLLDLVEAGQATLTEFVDKIEEAEKEQVIIPDNSTNVGTESGSLSPYVVSPSEPVSSNRT